MTLDTLHQRLLSLGAKPQHRGYFYRSLFGVVPRIKPDDPKFPLALRKALPELYAIVDGALVVADSHQAEEKDSLKLLTDGKVKVSELSTVYNLEDIEQAFEDTMSNKIMKAYIKVIK